MEVGNKQVLNYLNKRSKLRHMYRKLHSGIVEGGVQYDMKVHLIL